PLQIVAQAGAKIAVGELIAYVGTPSGRPAKATRDDANISPNARRLAESHGLDIAAIVGTGPDGRITRADVTAAVESGDRPVPGHADKPPEVTSSAAKGDVVVRELTRTQATIARRMAESSATIPDFTLDTDIDMGAAGEALVQLRAKAASEAPAPTVNDLIVKAAALGLRGCPQVHGPS